MEYLCPSCARPLSGPKGRPREGELTCAGCKGRYPVRGSIPRFVPEENYAGSFAFQWNRYARTQLDKFNGGTNSADRFFKVTGWPRNLKGQTVLEPGCGAGRFTQVVLESGAEVYSFDYSGAVDANLANNGLPGNLHLFQADIYRIPLPKGSFDRIFCLGVLQHCPGPKAAFLSLIPYLKPGGEIVMDVYQKTPRMLVTPKYWLRPFTKRMKKERLHRLVERIVPPLIPVKAGIRKIPVLGRYVAYFIPIACYKNILPLPDEQIVEWGILDTFDMLSPRYDKPQSLRTVRRWFQEAELTDVEVQYGPNGINGRGRRPSAERN